MTIIIIIISMEGETTREMDAASKKPFDICLLRSGESDLSP